VSAFTERLGGEWRDVAPTVAEIEAHAGWWWRSRERFAPLLSTLSTSDFGGGLFVWRSEGDEIVNVPAGEWDNDARDEWRFGALVCPCDGEGVPVPWPVVVVAK